MNVNARVNCRLDLLICWFSLFICRFYSLKTHVSFSWCSFSLSLRTFLFIKSFLFVFCSPIKPIGWIFLWMCYYLFTIRIGFHRTFSDLFRSPFSLFLFNVDSFIPVYLEFVITMLLLLWVNKKFYYVCFGLMQTAEQKKGTQK